MLFKPRFLGLFCFVLCLGLSNAFAQSDSQSKEKSSNQKAAIPRMLSSQEARLLNLLSYRILSQTSIDETVVELNFKTRSMISELNQFLTKNGPAAEGSIQWLINDCKKDPKQFRFWYTPCQDVKDRLLSVANRYRNIIMDAHFGAKNILSGIDTIIFAVKMSENADVSSSELEQYQVFANQIARLTEIDAGESDSRYGYADRNAERAVEFLNSISASNENLEEMLEKAQILKTSLERTLLIYRE